MENTKPVRRALALLSGGLDSLLATRLLLEQGIEVTGLNFYTGFCVEGHTQAVRQNHNKPKRHQALWAAEQLGIPLEIIDVIEEYQSVLTNPQFGYGANLNPCVDCKIFMLKKAEAYRKAHGFDFIITGEVLGQRPKSQNKRIMPVIQKESGVNDRLLRPLCAKNLPPTYPEQQGWVDREQLLDITGRSRTQQMALAEQWGFKDYAQPAGGCCFLTDESYARKLKDLWQARGHKKYTFDDIMLLKIGRHIRPQPNFKLIIGREEGENNYLEGYRKQFIHLRPMSHMGPLTLIDGELQTDDDRDQAAQIAARYCQGAPGEEITLALTDQAGQIKNIIVKKPAPESISPQWMV